MVKLTREQTSIAKNAFKKAAIADIMSEDELLKALIAINPKFMNWQSASKWVDEFDDIGFVCRRGFSFF